MSSHRKCQSHAHATGIKFHSCIEKCFNLREIDDFIKLAIDLLTTHAQHCTIEIDIFTPGQFRMKAGTHFQKGSYSAAQAHLSFGGSGDPRQDLEQCAFSGAITADHANRLSGRDFKRNIAECPESL